MLAKIPADTAASVKRKYRLARAAQPAWARLRPIERIDAMTRFREQLVARREDLANILTAEVGKPIAQSRNELTGVLARIDFFINNTTKILKDEIVFADRGEKLEEKISFEPLGVVANISAWNYPYFVGANVFVPALLTGNAVLYKPSEFATLTGLEIAKLLHAAGVPADVFAPVIGGGEVGCAARTPTRRRDFLYRFVRDRRQNRGDCRQAHDQGPARARRQGPGVRVRRRGHRSGGGVVADGAFYNTGQSCCAVERIYVHERIHDDFVEAFVAAVRGFKVGDPRDETTYIGPLTRKAQLAVLKRRLPTPGKTARAWSPAASRSRAKAISRRPCVDADHRMELMREESFGPVIGIQKVSDDAEALRLMNDTEYGLTAGVYTPDRGRAEKILAQVNSGSVYWNCCDRVSPRLPWSGTGHSGVGLTLSTYGIQTFLRPKAWHLRAV